jgi:transposase
MPAERTIMRRVREVLRLKFVGGVPTRARRAQVRAALLYRQKDFFNRAKHYRGVATRYEKLGANFLAMVNLAAVRIWLRRIESTI